MFQPMFSFVKGRIEADWAALDGVETVISLRPGGILKRGEKGIGEAILNGGFGWLRYTPIGITAEDIALAGVHACLGGLKPWEGKRQLPTPFLDGKLQPLENNDLKAVARQLEAFRGGK